MTMTTNPKTALLAAAFVLFGLGASEQITIIGF